MAGDDSQYINCGSTSLHNAESDIPQSLKSTEINIRSNQADDINNSLVFGDDTHSEEDRKNETDRYMDHQEIKNNVLLKTFERDSHHIDQNSTISVSQLTQADRNNSYLSNHREKENTEQTRSSRKDANQSDNTNNLLSPFNRYINPDSNGDAQFPSRDISLGPTRPTKSKIRRTSKNPPHDNDYETQMIELPTVDKNKTNYNDKLGNGNENVNMEPFIDADTQTINSNDKNIVKPIGDIQVVHKDVQVTNDDTQVIYKDTQVIGKDTQVVYKGTGVINKDTQVNNSDTQIINTDTHTFNKDTQIDNEDTQVIGQVTHTTNESTEIIDKDTQVIKHVLHDINESTQIIDEDKKANIAEPQPTNKGSQTSDKEFDEDTLVINLDRLVNYSEGQTFGKDIADDTQVINMDRQVDNSSSQQLDISNSYSGDTLIINKPNNGQDDLLSTPSKLDESYLFSPYSQVNKNETQIQIPNTEAKINATKSMTQVVNTQEDFMVDDTFEKIDLSTKPVYSSSQNKNVMNQNLGDEDEDEADEDEADEDESEIESEDEIIKTDQENDDIEIPGILQFEDSIISHRKRKRLPDMNNSNKKIMPNDEDKNDSLYLDSLSETENVPATHDHGEFIKSSPVNEKNIHTTSDSKEDDITIQPNQKTPELTDIVIKRETLPSSPTHRKSNLSTDLLDLSQSVNDISIRGNQNDDYNKNIDKDDSRMSSDLEDIDDENYGSGSEYQIEEEDSKIIAKKRPRSKKQYVIRSQSQTDTSGLIQSSNDSLNNNDEIKEDEPIFRIEKLETLTEDQIINKTSVFASYKFKIYPGMVIKNLNNEISVVNFIEGESEIRNDDLFLLDIRIGDKIKIRSTSLKYTVTGLTNLKLSDDYDNNIRCIRGYNYVYLQRSSKSKNQIQRQKSKSEEFGVPLSECLMELPDFIRHQQFNQLKYHGIDLMKENYNYFHGIFMSNQSDDIENMKYNENENENIRKVPQKLNRVVSGNIRNVSGTRVSPRKNHIVDKGGGLGGDKLYSGWIFFMTSILEDEKHDIKSIIRNHGGVLVEEKSIKDIFQYNDDNNNNGNLKLNLEFLQDFKIGVIISSTFCRSAKYLQGLALGWPILSKNFIYDCNQNSNKLNQWSMYLLPAGESKYLGTIKSIDIFRFRYNYEIKQKPLIEQLNNNSLLLKDYKIIIFNKNRTNLSILETCEFIFKSFGIKLIIKVKNQEEIKNFLKNYKDLTKTLIYINENDEVNENISKFGMKTIGLNLNVKTSSMIEKLKNLDDSNNNNKNDDDNNNVIKIGIINWEWVVQCVISQYIWEPKLYFLFDN